MTKIALVTGGSKGIGYAAAKATQQQRHSMTLDIQLLLPRVTKKPYSNVHKD